MKNKDLYRIVLTCWDYGEPKPYNDYVSGLYNSFDEAYKEMKKCAIQETEGLNEPTTPPSETEGHFKVDFNGDNHAIVRLWEFAEDVEGSNDYMNVTAYNIHKIADYETAYKYRGFWILKTKSGYAVEQFDTIISREKTLELALEFVDYFLVNFVK